AVRGGGGRPDPPGCRPGPAGLRPARHRAPVPGEGGQAAEGPPEEGGGQEARHQEAELARPPSQQRFGKPRRRDLTGHSLEIAWAAVRIAPWNLAALPSERQDRLHHFLEYAQPDVLCLQETKLSDDAFPALDLLGRGYESVHHGEGRWNGV